MSYQGFGKASGPTAPPKLQHSFGNSAPPASVSPPPLRTPSQHDALGSGVPSHPMAFQTTGAASGLHHHQFNSGPGATVRMRSPSLAFENPRSVATTSHSYLPEDFRRGPGASVRMRSPSLAFENPRSVATTSHSYSPEDSRRSAEGSFLSEDIAAQSHREIASGVTVQNSDHVVDEGGHLHTKRTRSPTYMSGDEKLPKMAGHHVIRRPVSPTFVDQPKVRGVHVKSQAYQGQSPSERFYDHDSNILTGFGNVQAPKRTKSPEKRFVSDLGPAQSNLQRSVSQAYQDQSLLERFYDHDSNILTGFGNVQAPKRTKSPEKPFVSDLGSALTNLKRPSISPPRSFSGSNAHDDVDSMKNVYSESIVTKPTSASVPKRTRSPGLPSSDQVSGDNSHSTHDDSERERLAKAKRLARFKNELAEVAHNNVGSADLRDDTNKNEHSTAEKNKYMSNQSLDLSGNLAHGSSLPDYEALESSTIIIGMCPDMCPESERAERERKGDLDYYERLDGDRNQTNKLLAVKKYSRTAEREANLIRPMPVLLKTTDYLLDLLSQPYDEKFLGIYNFLWDRMRAIRMDLRMQHLFNENAITMLEQMIRLHIIAMHELCEFSKGEGFAEGFDAHLNIEQMNKASVELFQMYDDHRKRGIVVLSEKEFRGYYALLKLDKHPGYKVEPAELSLDLAKMSPEMRQTPEVKFARDVARACRTSNFIAFFRLVREASYLQACLMHAHFAKLRTQALASLHSGVQNNQGLPMAHLRKWIGMEEEDIEGLLEYHGFSIKEFEEPYMVREGPFLNSNTDFATKCSKLVHMKRSKMIVNDVLSRSKNEYMITDATKLIPLTRSKKESPTFSIEKISSPRTVSTEKQSSMHAIDEEMTEFGDDQLIPVDREQMQPMTEAPKFVQLHEYNCATGDALLRQSSPRPCEPLRTEVTFVGNQSYADLFSSPKKSHDGLFMTSPVKSISTGMGVSFPPVSDVSFQNISVCGSKENVMGSIEPQRLFNNVMEDEEILCIEESKQDIVMESQGEEIANARLKLILRLWRRRAVKRKKLREQRLLAAKAAFDTLSVGPPVQLNDYKIKSVGVLDIDDTMRERWKNQKLSWSVVNVSEVIASTMSRRNADEKCICWKLVVCSQMDNISDLNQRTRDSRFAAGSWLLSKLMPSKANDLVISTSFTSIWRSWFSDETGKDLSCFLSIVKDVNFGNLPETVHGVSAILFVATETISLDLQRDKLHKLLMSIPSGSCLPLLILSDLCGEDSAVSMLANRLGLCDIDKSKICNFQVVSLLDNPQSRNLGFFSDEKLKEGLKWLANESPSQPVLHCVKVLDLIIAHLNLSMDVLDSMKDRDVSPNHCIAAFNLALDQSLVDITAAVKANPSNWPCPEIALLESCDEHTITTHALPPVGWSSVENVEPLKQALMSLKLPTFPDLSWLTKGSNLAKEIPTERDNLESCLSCYLTQTSQIMGQQLAMEEAHVMLQKCAKLELHEFNYFIIPRWATIFRRIFSWKLRYFSGRSSYVHIVDCCHGASVTSSIWLESREPPLYQPNQPLLDEVIEVACNSLSTDLARQWSEAHQPLAVTTSNNTPHEVFAATINFADDDSDSPRQIAFVSSGSVPNLGLELNCTGKEVVASGAICSEASRLNELLDQCNKLQEAIERKLSIYF